VDLDGLKAKRKSDNLCRAHAWLRFMRHRRGSRLPAQRARTTSGCSIGVRQIWQADWLDHSVELSMTTTSERSDLLHFFRAWIANPLRVAAVAPSGETLARLMTHEISAEHGPILELGPGTGVFTRALLARGISEHDLTLVEYGSDFVPMLQHRFPEARILTMDAAKLGHLDLFGREPAGAVISGLPLLSMSPRKVTAILAGCFKHIRRGGAFYQFTYGPVCPVPRPILDRLGLKAKFIGRTVRNLPPAAVYRITRRRQLVTTSTDEFRPPAH
jgi:phosphatidylethanolamine/phosphatidyl-N-methylethanolamine N-methyltransferase